MDAGDASPADRLITLDDSTAIVVVDGLECISDAGDQLEGEDVVGRQLQADVCDVPGFS